MASIIMTAEYVHAGMSSLSISAASHCTSELRIRVRVISRIDVTLSEGQGGQARSISRARPHQMGSERGRARPSLDPRSLGTSVDDGVMCGVANLNCAQFIVFRYWMHRS